MVRYTIESRSPYKFSQACESIRKDNWVLDNHIVRSRHELIMICMLKIKSVSYLYRILKYATGSDSDSEGFSDSGSDNDIADESAPSSLRGDTGGYS